MIYGLKDIWEERALRKDPLHAVMSERWTPIQRELATSTLKTALYGQLGDVAGKRILECGSGVGRFTHELVERDARIYGIDLSMNMIHRARDGQRDASFVNGSVSGLPFPDHYFDASFEVTVLIHLVDDMLSTKALHEMKRVVRPGGLIISLGPLSEDLSVNLGPTGITKDRFLQAYIDAIGLGEPRVQKTLCVDEVYSLISWRKL